MDVSVIIVAAGLGRRMGNHATPKQFMPLLGKPLLSHTIIPFESIPKIREIILLVPPGWEEYCRVHVVEAYRFKKVTKILSGGAERQDTVYRGLQEVSPEIEIVAIHDGARPLVTGPLIESCIQMACAYGGALVAIPLTDTPKLVTAEGLVTQTLKRDGIWLAQTPQTFRKEIILKAYESALSDGFYSTDDAALVERIGYSVKIVPGSPTNLKVTTPDDLRLAEGFLT